MLNTIDHVAIALYFVLIFGVAIYVTLKERKRSGVTSESYFLGGRNIGWFVIGASLFASNIGAEHLVGLAGSGASGDFPAAQFELLASFMLLILGWVFVPIYLRSGVYTMPEFLERRYSKSARNYLSIISIAAYVLTKISVTIAAGGVVFEAIGVPFWTGALIIVVVTGIYTIFGGIRAVVYTDMIQMFILIGGSIAVTFLGLQHLGGWGEMVNIVEPDFLNLWRKTDHPNFPWTGILLGAPILGIWYWCTDQFIVQRVLAAKDISNARKGTIFGGFLKITPLFIFVIPGVIAYAISQKGGFVMENTDAALPLLITHVMPTGIKGLVVAGLLAALMSSLSSVFNSCSTLFTVDIYKPLRPKASERELVFTGQLATAVLVVLGLAWIPLMGLLESGLFVYLQKVQAYIAPPIAAVFLLGLFFYRPNARGAMASLLTGAVLGVTRLVLEMNLDTIGESMPGFLRYFAEINFLHFAFLLFVICSVVLVVVSALDKTEPSEGTKQLLSREEDKVESAQKEKRMDVVLSILLVVMILIIWAIFS